MRAALLLVALLAPACSYQWGGADSALPLVGTSADRASLTRLNTTPCGPAAIIHGADGSPWAAFCEYRDGATRTASWNGCRQLHLSRLAGARTDETWRGTSFVVRPRAIYAIADDDQQHRRTITVHRPGDAPGLDASFTVAATPGILYTNEGGDNDVFAWWPRVAGSATWQVLRRDRRHQLTLPVPYGADPVNPGDSMDFLFDAAGDRLVISTPAGDIEVHSTLDGSVTLLGHHPGTIFLDEDRQAVLVAWFSLDSVPLNGGEPTVLAPMAVEWQSLTWNGDGDAWYRWRGGLWRVPLDGSAAPVRVVEQAARLLGWTGDATPVYSLDDDTRWVNGAGDGWIGSERILERGFLVGFSPDGQRVRVVEHAATTNAVGALESVRIGSGGEDRITLARNAGTIANLAGGRVLAITNQAQVGSWNRLVLIDEAAGEARLLLDGAADFQLVTPGEREVVVDVVSGASGYDLYRLPLPAP